MSFSVLEDQIRECYGRIIYTHKTHLKNADICEGTLRKFKIFQIVIAVVTASSSLLSLFFPPIWIKATTAVGALLTLVVSGYMKGFDPGGTAQKHHDTASRLWPVRESYLSLLTDLRMGTISPTDAIKKRDELQEKLAALYRSAPQTSPEAYALAQTGLKDNEEYTFSDAEVDQFLPESLRKTAP